MKNIVVFGATNSKESINKQLAVYTGQKLENVQLTVLDLNDYKLPIYGIDIEKEEGVHAEAIKFNNEIQNADAYIISFAEHNGSYSAVFKNAYDWISRVNKNVWGDKPTLLLATSPGARGGLTVLETAKASFPFMGAKVVGAFSLPSFYDHFKNGQIVNERLDTDLTSLVAKLQEVL